VEGAAGPVGGCRTARKILIPRWSSRLLGARSLGRSSVSSNELFENSSELVASRAHEVAGVEESLREGLLQAHGSRP
jgi:hypothetical protein